LRGKTAPPLRHTGCARFEILRDLFVALSLTRQQNNPCPLNQTLLGFAPPQPLLQNLTLIVKKLDSCRLSRHELSLVNLR